MKDSALSQLARYYGYPCLVAAILAGAIGTALGLFACSGYGAVTEAAHSVLPGCALLWVIVAHIERRQLMHALAVWAAMTVTILIALNFGMLFGNVFWPDFPWSIEDAVMRFRTHLMYGLC